MGGYNLIILFAKAISQGEIKDNISVKGDYIFVLLNVGLNRFFP